MNKFSLFGLAAAFSTMAAATSAQAIQVTAAKLDSAKQNILVDIRYGGGCEKHSFSLKMNGCAESMPVQCRAEIYDSVVDGCEALISETVVFNLKKLGLTTEYYSEGSFTIVGERGSQATVRLPKSGGAAARVATIKCKTHTGSNLTITPSTKTARIVNTGGDEKSYSIVKTDAVVIETMKPIDQTTYKLDDGRSIVVEFRDGAKTGIGYFIRLAGNASPQFNCEMK